MGLTAPVADEAVPDFRRIAKLRFPLPCRGTVWVSDRMQPPVYRWRPPTWRREPSGHRSWDHSNDRRTLVIHSLDDGRSSQAAQRSFSNTLETKG